MFKKLEINISFPVALAHMARYAKFMKDIINKKRKLDESGVVSPSVNCSANIKKNLQQKMQDPVPCTIGNHEFGKALCDSGANINLMPLSVVRRLSLGELSPTTMSLKMADRSMAQPKGILEDVLVKVRKFIFPVDFVVLDIEEDKQIPLFLSRPFLATSAALIDVKNGELTLRVGTEEVHFNLNQSLKQHEVEQAQCMRINSVIPVSKEKNDDFMNENSHDEYVFNPLYEEDMEKEELKAEVELTGAVLSLSEENIDALRGSGVKIQEGEKSFEGLILKELPKHLKYVFLGEEKSKHVVITTNLTTKKEKKSG